MELVFGDTWWENVSDKPEQFNSRIIRTICFIRHRKDHASERQIPNEVCLTSGAASSIIKGATGPRPIRYNELIEGRSLRRKCGGCVHDIDVAEGTSQILAQQESRMRPCLESMEDQSRACTYLCRR